MDNTKNIFVIEDDAAARRAVVALLESHNYHAMEFETAEQFLESYKDDMPGCIILDLHMPGLSGLELQEQLITKNFHIPIIFVTGNAKVSWSVQAMRKGAVNFLEKPYENGELITSIDEALEQDSLNRRIGMNCTEVVKSYDLLTKREREVVEYLVFGTEGSTNKQIAKKMNISFRTVEEYRAEAMRKMHARSLNELVTMVLICKLSHRP